jgi:hypothetical protein
VPIYPNAIIANQNSPTNPNVGPLHQVNQEVVQAAACHKNLLANDNVAIVKSIVQYPPSLLQNAKSALHVLSDAFEVH